MKKQIKKKLTKKELLSLQLKAAREQVAIFMLYWMRDAEPSDKMEWV